MVGWLVNRPRMAWVRRFPIYRDRRNQPFHSVLNHTSLPLHVTSHSFALEPHTSSSPRNESSARIWLGGRAASSRGEQLVLERLNVFLNTLDKAAPGGEGWIPEPSPEYAVRA
jgi:hypothetical protein